MSEEEGGGGLLSRETLQHLMMTLEYIQYKTYDDLQNIAMLWFHPSETEARETLIQNLRCAEAGRIKLSPDSLEQEPRFEPWCPEEESMVVEGGHPSEIPELLLQFKQEIRRQVAIIHDDLRKSGKDLDVQGHLTALQERTMLSCEILASDVFIRGMDEGQMVIVTGVPGAGKSEFAVGHIAAPAYAAGWAIVSNIQIKDPPEHYHYCSRFSQALVACIDETLTSRKVMLIQDEGGLSRERSRTQTNVNRSQASATKVSRKLGFCHVLIYQFEHDVPREVSTMAQHIFHKPAKDNPEMVYCQTPFLHGLEIMDLPSNKKLKKMGRPHFEFRTKDFSPFEVDADFSPLLQAELARTANVRSKEGEKGKKKGSDIERDQLKAIRAKLIALSEGPQYYKPLDIDQLHRLLAVFHMDDPRMSYGKVFSIFKTDFEHNNIKDFASMKRTLISWGFRPHPKTAPRIAICPMHQKLENKDLFSLPLEIPDPEKTEHGGVGRVERREHREWRERKIQKMKETIAKKKLEGGGDSIEFEHDGPLDHDPDIAEALREAFAEPAQPAQESVGMSEMRKKLSVENGVMDTDRKGQSLDK